MARKTRRQKAVSQFLLIIILLVACVVGIDRSDYLLAFWTGSFAVAVAAFAIPVRCGALNRDGSACRNTTYGVLFGCHNHTWIKFKTHFGRRAPAVRQQSYPQAPTTTSSGSVGSVNRDGAMFWLTIIATSAGTISMTTDVLGLFS